MTGQIVISHEGDLFTVDAGGLIADFNSFEEARHYAFDLALRLRVWRITLTPSLCR